MLHRILSCLFNEFVRMLMPILLQLSCTNVDNLEFTIFFQLRNKRNTVIHIVLIVGYNHVYLSQGVQLYQLDIGFVRGYEHLGTVLFQHLYIDDYALDCLLIDLPINLRLFHIVLSLVENLLDQRATLQVIFYVLLAQSIQFFLLEQVRFYLFDLLSFGTIKDCHNSSLMLQDQVNFVHEFFHHFLLLEFDVRNYIHSEVVGRFFQLVTDVAYFLKSCPYLVVHIETQTFLGDCFEVAGACDGGEQRISLLGCKVHLYYKCTYLGSIITYSTSDHFLSYYNHIIMHKWLIQIKIGNIYFVRQGKKSETQLRFIDILFFTKKVENQLICT